MGAGLTMTLAFEVLRLALPQRLLFWSNIVSLLKEVTRSGGDKSSSWLLMALSATSSSADAGGLM